MKFSDFERTDETTSSLTDIIECPTSKLLNEEDETDLAEERFRVDRRKLEQMLQGETVENQEETAEIFFHRIMDETNTQISWPSKLKVGAKSKKDPHIKITGQPDAVFLAREKVLEVLDTERNRVTLKMDVSFTDHSHIIGKGGHNIQQVMEETGCHIHFPDSNRNNTGEKSNQVSIAGQPHGVEQARCKIRELLPMIVTFELPITGYLQPVPDASSPGIQLIQQTYGFAISFRQKQRGQPTTVLVRGCRRQFHQLRQGLVVLMDYLTGNTGTVLPVNLSMEIAPQHHSFVMGRNGVNIQMITRETGATITFPDTSSLSSNSAFQPVQSRKSTVVISGSFDGVCLAWQELMDCLPLVLMFDLKEGQELDTAQVTKLMDNLNINIVIRPKPKQNTKSILVRGVEKNSRVLFEVRRQLLDLDRSEVPQCCERHGAIPLSPLSGNLENLPEQIFQEKIKIPDSSKDYSTQNQGNPAGFPSGYPGIPQVPPVFNTANSSAGLGYPLLPWLLTQISMNPANAYNALIQAQLLNCSQHLSDLAFTGMFARSMKEFPRVPPSDQASTGSQASTLSSPNVSPCESPIFMTKSDGSSCAPSNSSSTDSLASEKDSYNNTAWNSRFWVTENDVHQENGKPLVFRPDSHCLASQQPMGRPIVSGSSSTCKSTENIPNADGSSQRDVGTVGCERQNGLLNSSSNVDYDRKRLLAAKAFQKPVNSQERVPTATWSGYGFSKSTPQALFKNQLLDSGVHMGSSKLLDNEASGATYDKTWQHGSTYGNDFNLKDQNFAGRCDSLFSSSNYFDSMLPNAAIGLNTVKDLSQLLTQLRLEKYIDVFHQQQVDLSAFLTLTEKDLQELGIPYGVRQRMLRAISELNNTESSMSSTRAFQAAPGAERRALFTRISQQNRPIAEAENGW